MITKVRASAEKTAKEKEFVSVIVPTLNEERHIGACIDSIKKCGYPIHNYEIIVVDNGSTDSTVERVRSYGITVLVDTTKTVAGLRNLGSSKAKGDIYAFLDADCRVAKYWAKNGVSVLRDRAVGMAGSLLGIPQEANWIEKTWYLHLRSRENGQGDVKYINSGNCFVRKEVYEELGGFSEELCSGEDVDLCKRITDKGYKIIACGGIHAIHFGYPGTLTEFVKREAWHGIGAARSNISSFWRSKPLIVVFYNLAVSFLTIILASIGEVRNVALGLLLMAPALFLACQTASKVKKVRYIGPLALLYVLYGVGRTIALLRFLVMKLSVKTVGGQEQT